MINKIFYFLLAGLLSIGSFSTLAFEAKDVCENQGTMSKDELNYISWYSCTLPDDENSVTISSFIASVNEDLASTGADLADPPQVDESTHLILVAKGASGGTANHSGTIRGGYGGVAVLGTTFATIIKNTDATQLYWYIGEQGGVFHSDHWGSGGAPTLFLANDLSASDGDSEFFQNNTLVIGGGGGGATTNAGCGGWCGTKEHKGGDGEVTYSTTSSVNSNVTDTEDDFSMEKNYGGYGGGAGDEAENRAYWINDPDGMMKNAVTDTHDDGGNGQATKAGGGGGFIGGTFGNYTQSSGAGGNFVAKASYDLDHFKSLYDGSLFDRIQDDAGEAKIIFILDEMNDD